MEPPARRLDAFSDRQRTRESKTLQAVLEVCDRYDIPITFDIVGHLLLESCDGHRLSPHEAGWFDADPGTDVRTDPLFYAPDLVEDIIDADVDHELGTHTFSHVPCDTVSTETVDWEISNVRTAHERAGLERPTTLVPPMHREPPVDVLCDHGIDVIRMPDGTYPSERNIVRRFGWHFTRDPPRADPENTGGLTRVSTTHSPSLTAVTLPMGQLDPHPGFRILPKAVRKRVHRRYLERALDAVRTGSNVHLWTHLWDLSNDDQWSLVGPFLENVGTASRNNDVTVRTLDELTVTDTNTDECKH
ncbi:polysaccharide deacetylase family protein [Natronorubrum sp. FCH18a]|uniref:polysaccharide deacetylase family protein n=1 Tax=Natronorubrum sp. FCH18a TaxID=3447018 RepID=UPI003F50ED37